MRARLLLAVSLLANVALVGGLFWVNRSPHASSQTTSSSLVREIRLTNATIKTNYVVRRQNLTWSDIESADYLAYVQNLRNFGCPEDTIRDIILADVNHLFNERRKREILPADKKWWTSEIDPKTLEEEGQKQLALETERRTLLTQLLGPNWQQAIEGRPSDNYVFGGPVLSALSENTQAAVRNILDQSGRAVEEYLRQQSETGADFNAAEYAQLQVQQDAELAKILTPEQLEEFQLRYSPVAEQMRYDLRGFDATPEEFRAMYRARAAIDQQLQLLGDSDDSAIVQRRKELEAARDTAINNALPPDKREQYTLSQQPEYRETQELATQFELPKSAVTPLYNIRQAIQQEQQRIENDTTLSDEQRTQALEQMNATAQQTMRDLLGEETYKRIQPNFPDGSGNFTVTRDVKGFDFTYE